MCAKDIQTEFPRSDFPPGWQAAVIRHRPIERIVCQTHDEVATVLLRGYAVERKEGDDWSKPGQ